MGENINTEGIFRISARAQTVEILREAYDRGQKFIIWREGKTLATWPHHKEGYGDVAIRDDELEQIDGYDALTAAAMIKLWYKELREPIFLQGSYQALKKLYGDPDTPLETAKLLQILAPGTEYSPLHQTASSILILHLLPLLSRLAEHAESNKMTPSNLAVCFAPSLLCGPDPFEDVKISSIIRRILTAMIEKWTTHLAPALSLTNDLFDESLQLPKKVEDREDPLEEVEKKSPSTQTHEGQMSGIALLDNDNSTSSSEADSDDDTGGRPPLPPRPRAATLATDIPNNTLINPIRRKPAPPIHTPPRYSSLIPNQTAALARCNLIRIGGYPRNTVEEAEEPEERRASIDTLPRYEERTILQDEEMLQGAMSIPRKPVGEGEGKGGG